MIIFIQKPFIRQTSTTRKKSVKAAKPIVHPAYKRVIATNPGIHIIVLSLSDTPSKISLSEKANKDIYFLSL